MSWQTLGRTLALLAGVALPGGDVAAQRTAVATARVRSSLDSWLVMRFRDAQLLDDSVAVRPSGGVRFPRVESVRRGTIDTLYALHFAGGDSGTALRVASVVRLSGPSGAMSTHTARILARRAFRAPGVTTASTSDAPSSKSWRYGWSYVAVVTGGRRPPGAAGYRGWLLVASPESQRSAPTGAPPAR